MKIYKMIKINLIDSEKYLPENIISDILNIIPFNNCFTKYYLKLAKFIYDDYHVKEVRNIQFEITIFLFYKEYGIKLNRHYDIEARLLKNADIHLDTIYRIIIDNDLKSSRIGWVL